MTSYIATVRSSRADKAQRDGEPSTAAILFSMNPTVGMLLRRRVHQGLLTWTNRGSSKLARCPRNAGLAAHPIRHPGGVGDRLSSSEQSAASVARAALLDNAPVRRATLERWM